MSHPPIKQETRLKIHNLMIEALKILIEDQGLTHDAKAVKANAIPTSEWYVFGVGHGNVSIEIKANIVMHDPSYEEVKIKFP